MQRGLQHACRAEEPAWTLLQAESAMGNWQNVYTVLDTMIAYGMLLPQEQDDPIGYARFYSIIGEKEKALDLAEMALEEYGRLPLEPLLYYVEFDHLRAEPRFKALLEKTGLLEVINENGQIIQPIDESLEAYKIPGSW